MDDDATLILKPKFGFWIERYFAIIIIEVLIAVAYNYFDCDDPIFDMALKALFILIWIMLCYTYVDMLFCTKWIITKDELIYRRGVFSRHEAHTELYRVVDYSESQSFLQLIFRNKTVKVISGDVSDPVSSIYGIDTKTPVIKVLRERVRITRKEAGIYEVTNR